VTSVRVVGREIDVSVLAEDAVVEKSAEILHRVVDRRAHPLRRALSIKFNASVDMVIYREQLFEIRLLSSALHITRFSPHHGWILDP